MSGRLLVCPGGVVRVESQPKMQKKKKVERVRNWRLLVAGGGTDLVEDGRLRGGRTNFLLNCFLKC